MDVEIGIMTGTPDKQKKLVLTSGILAYLGNLAGTAAYYSVNNVTISESRNFIEHTMPGRKGSVFQDMGRPAIKIIIEGNISEDGIYYGLLRGGKGKNKIRLEELHELCDAGKPVDFLCDMPALFGVSSVIIQELEATEVKGRKHNYNYKLTLKEWSESKPSFDARSKYGFAKDAGKKLLKKSIVVGAAVGVGAYVGHTLGTTYAPKLAVNIQMNKRIVTAEEVVEIKASVNDSKGNPIADADVKVMQGDSKELFSGKTNAEGIASAEFQSPDAGTYAIKATASKSDYLNGEASANITVDTQIKARMTTDKATITTSGTATLKVTVADCNGKAIDGVEIELKCEKTGSTITIKPEKANSTDGSITAEFSATPAGSYEVKATAKKSPYTDGNASITIKVTS